MIFSFRNMDEKIGFFFQIIFMRNNDFEVSFERIFHEREKEKWYDSVKNIIYRKENDEKGRKVGIRLSICIEGRDKNSATWLFRVKRLFEEPSYIRSSDLVVFLLER